MQRAQMPVVSQMLLINNAPVIIRLPVVTNLLLITKTANFTPPRVGGGVNKSLVF